jgi:alkylation response protein AidB-like acyl-CoA dehydrogenase
MAALEGIAFVRCEPSRPEDAERLTAFGALLGAARLGVSRRVLEWAVEHLSGRVVDAEPTIRKQLVLGTLADVLTGVEAARRLLLAAGSVPAAVTEAHDWTTELDWESAKLLGASGFITDSPSRGGYVSRLVANCWIARKDGAP